MRTIKVIVKKRDCYETHLIILDNLAEVICTYPKDEEETSGVTQNIENAISSQSGQKIEFVMKDTPNIEFDLNDNPAVFIINDDYGNEIDKTEDLEEVEQAILESISTAEEIEDFPPDPTGFSPTI